MENVIKNFCLGLPLPESFLNVLSSFHGTFFHSRLLDFLVVKLAFEVSV